MKIITLLTSILFLLFSCSKEETQKSQSGLTTKELTPLKLSSGMQLDAYEQEVRKHIIIIQMDLMQSGYKDQSLKEKLALCYFRLSIIKKGVFKEHFINKAFGALEKERNEEVTQHYLKAIKESDEG